MKCKVCGKNAQSEYCFLHKPKKQLTNRMGPTSKLGVGSSIQKRTSKQLSREIEKKIQTHKMFEFFIDIWKIKPHKSEISGEYLGKEPLSVYFHHILPKNKYPEACFDEENIVILSLLEHEQVESDMYRYEEINNRRKKLLIKYNLNYD
jgi:hypothetical protein